jgi:hypothetical protein
MVEGPSWNIWHKQQTPQLSISLKGVIEEEEEEPRLLYETKRESLSARSSTA